ncbi:MAG: hypothetical protein KatS3mg052_0370 [Candidatus Roseilinea sp.]|nr:MAG: hypothetical protein KatS3mg052_0370 [Candidatus Roseilinea sp.]
MIPAASPASNPSHSLCVAMLTSTPAQAEMSMMPSRAMLATPPSSAINPPSAGSKIGVVTRNTAATKVALKIA